MSKNSMLSKHELKESIMLLAKRRGLVTAKELGDLIGQRKKLICKLVKELADKGDLTELKYSDRARGYCVPDSQELTKEDIKRAIRFYYGNKCNVDNCRCKTCKAHKWLDKVWEENND